MPGLSAVSANRCRITASPVGMQSKAKSRKWSHHIALFGIEYLLIGRSRSGVRLGIGVGIVRPESESESLKIRRLRSPGSKLTRYLVSLNTSQFDNDL